MNLEHPVQMARTLDPAAHAVRRDTFLDAAQRLIQVKGYHAMSIQDVLDEAGTSKGAFYHYYGSKADLLDGVIERMVEQATAVFEPIVADPDLPAPVKLQSIFSGLAAFKAERRDLVLGLIETWLSDDNALVREKFRREVAVRLTPQFEAIVHQGRAEGTFSAGSDEAAGVLVSLVLGANLRATELFVARQAGTVTLEEVHRGLNAYAEAFDRVLGAPPGTLPLASESVLRDWYG